MAPIRTFVSHHGGDFEDRVQPILRSVAPRGVRPWIDKIDLGDHVGLPLAEQLGAAIFHGPCSSMSLFLSKQAATRKWIEQEVEWALQRLIEKRGDGFRILPIFLDPPDAIETDLPDNSAFRRLLKNKPLWLEPQQDKLFRQKYAQSVWSAGGLTSTSQEMTLCLGHRNPSWTVEIPAQYAHAPTLDLRVSLHGQRLYCPADGEWREIEEGLCAIDSYLTGLKRINICGPAPLGVGTLIGKVWDRGTSVRLHCDNFFNGVHQTWTTDAQDFLLSDNWSPDRAKLIEMNRPASLRHNAMVMAFLPRGRATEYLPHVERWNGSRPPTLLQPVLLPDHVADPQQASQLVKECVGAIRYVRRACPGVRLIEVISGYPLALAPLVAQCLRTSGPLHFYDEVRDIHDYQLAAIIG